MAFRVGKEPEAQTGHLDGHALQVSADKERGLQQEAGMETSM